MAQNLLKNLGETNNKFQDYLKNPNEHSMFLKETDPDEVYKILKNLDVKKATDIFGIPPKLVTMAANTLKNQITILFNLSITQEICPDELKTGKINPVHKFESKMLYSNYRPISILPLFSKVFESLMFNRIYNFVIKHEIIYKNQFGFQKGKSTEHAILDLYTNLLQAIEKQHKISCIFLDFAKAFDTVNHDILIKKLEYYGIKGKPLNWLIPCLSNIKQAVKIGQTLSSFQIITCGVPQGSILGPLLFLIYINDIHVSSPQVKFHHFADDTCIFHSSKDATTLQSDLKANKLTLNVKKSNLLFFNIGNNEPKKDINIYLDGEQLKPKEYAKYLGVYIDNKLSWQNHIQETNNKINKGIGILKIMRHYLQDKQLINLYFSFIKPYIEYGTLAWGGACKTNLTKIDRSLNKSVRTMLFKNRREPSKPLYKYLNILPLEYNIKLLRGKFMHKLLSKKQPEIIEEKFPYFNESINNSDHTKLILPYYRTSIAHLYIIKVEKSGMKLLSLLKKYNTLNFSLKNI